MVEENGSQPEKGKKTRSSVLDHFVRISNDNEAVRLKNGLLLLKHLHGNTATGNDNDELKYALIRLVRGLGSSRLPAKMGFYSVLVTLLTTTPSLQATEILNYVNNQLQAGDSGSKSEAGDTYTGQILACGALIRSGLFMKASSEEQGQILEMLLKAGRKRSYLGLASSSFIADLLLKASDTEFLNCIWKNLKPELIKPWTEQTLDTLYLIFIILNRFPGVLKSGTLRKHFGSDVILCEDNVKPLCDILLNVAAVSSLKHPIYELVSKEIAKSDIVLPFVSQLNQDLNRQNRNRLLAVSIMIRTFLTTVKDPSQIPNLVVDNFVRQTVQYFSEYHNYNYNHEFHEHMQKFFDALFECFKREHVDDKIKISVLKRLLFYPGTFVLEKITKMKILQQLVSTLEADGVKRLSKLYKDVILAEKDKVVEEDGACKPWMNSERTYAAQLLAKLLGHPKIQGEIEWKVKYLKFLINSGIIRHQKHGNVGIELADTLRELFYRALDQKFSKLEDASNVLLELVNYLTSSLDPENYKEILRVPFTEEDFEMWQKATGIINKLSSKTNQKHILVFQILFLHMSLQLFKDKEMAMSSLNELFLCYDRIKNEKKLKKSNRSDDPEWIEVIVDLFLNLLSHNSHLLRNVIHCVYPHLCKYMTPSSVHQILSVLDPRNEENPLSKINDDSATEDEQDDDEKDEDDETDDSEEESDADEEEESETINDKLRMAIGKALGNNGYQTDEESIDLDDLSDSEGQKLDEALAEAFKQFKPNRGNNKKQSKDEEALTHFRVRVLDLLEMYLNSEPAMLSCLEIMLALLQLLEFTIRDVHQNPLQMRVRRCLKKLTGMKKFESLEGITGTVLKDLLQSLLDKGTKSSLLIQDMSSEISDCAVFVVKCSQIARSYEQTAKSDRNELKRYVTEVVTDAVTLFFDQRDCLIPYSMFKSVFQLNWDGNLALAPLVFGYIFNESTRPFRRSQALELLKIFYSNNRMRADREKFKSHFEEHERQFCNKIIQLLEEFCESPGTVVIKERFIYHVFNLLKSMAGHDSKSINWKTVGEKIRKYRSYVTLSKDAKQAYNQLCGKLNIPKQITMQHKTFKLNKEENEADDASKTTKKEKRNNKRRNGNLESKMLKKKSNELRFQSLSEGLSSSFSFNDVDMTDVRQPKKRLNSDDDKDVEHEEISFSKKKKRRN